MRYLITERQLLEVREKKTKDYSDIIKKLIMSKKDEFISKICKVEVNIVRTDDYDDDYIVLVYFDKHPGYRVSEKLEEYVQQFLPFNVAIFLKEEKCKD